MLDIGWSELVLIGVVALIFVGPKDLPRMFHALGRFTAKARGMAREFQRAMDDAAKTSGLDDVRKDLSGVKAGISAATNPAGFGINALEDAARKFENWDPKSVLKPAAAPAAVVATDGAATVATGAAAEPGPETKALAEKRAADAAAARAKAHELQAKAAASASATFAARAKADAEAASARMADESAAAPAPQPRTGAADAGTAGIADPAAEAAKPARKPPVRRKKSDE